MRYLIAPLVLTSFTLALASQRASAQATFTLLERGGRANLSAVTLGLLSDGGGRSDQPKDMVPPRGEPASDKPLTISADRPGFGDSSGVMPAAHLQLEAGYTFTF